MRVGIVGLGYWGPNLLRVLFETPGAAVTHLCDIDTDRLQKFALRYPTVQTTTEFEDLLNDPTVDAIIIATPVFTHFDLASLSLKAGKHTFVEKPLASSLTEAENLIEIAAQEERVLMCGLTFIYSPPVRSIKEMIDRDELGEILFVSSSRVNLGLHQRDISVIWDLGPHDFSILFYWLDQLPESVCAVSRDSIVQGTSDVAFVTMKFPSDLIAQVELSWLAPSKLRRTVIVGRNKMVVYEDGSPEPIRVFDHGVVYEDPETFGEYQLSYRTGSILSPKLDTVEPLALELEEFVKASTLGSAPALNTRLARDVVAVAELAEQSSMAGGIQLSLSGEPTVSQ